MGYQIPTTEPQELTAGLSWKWDKSLSDFPADDGWTLKYYLRRAAGPAPNLGAVSGLTITAGSTGAIHEVRELPAKSADLAPGIYDWVSTVEDGTDTYELEAGRLTVHPNLATLQSATSHAAKMVVLLEEAIESIASGKVQSYTLHNRTFTKLDLPELRKMLGDYRDELRGERLTGDEEFFTRVEHSFGVPT